MPKLTVVERDGKFVIVSQTEANGGPPDKYLAVNNGQFEVFDNREAAKGFGGQLYFITHYLDKHGDWLPKTYPMSLEV